MGGLHPQKDFPTLIRAFARVRSQRSARLVILGGTEPGREKYVDDLQSLSEAMGVADDVRFEGFVANPFVYAAHASASAFSSTHQGLGNALIEALACGCPVVSTDCVSDPREILGNGKFGPLVPVGNDVQMAEAIIQVLDDPLPSERLKARADAFGVDRAVQQYLNLLFGHDEKSG